MTTMALTRRRMAEEPVSQLAIWARRLAIFALLVAVLASSQFARVAVWLRPHVNISVVPEAVAP